MKVLVTGGAGYIGSHICVELMTSGHDVTVIDNLCNSSQVALQRVEKIAQTSLRFVQGDVRNAADLVRAFEGGIDAVIHMAALKAVGESCKQPLVYYDNNIVGTIKLLQTMSALGVANLVFSSSATVYGSPDCVPIKEDASLHVTNPYGRSKLVMEEIIGDHCGARPGFSAVLLRYFNPVGAHASGLIGENPLGAPNNLMPYITQVAAGRRPELLIFGDDYPTVDGTGVRDYIHVVDLARAHVRALDFVSSRRGCRAINLGTGCGHSVLQVVREFERVTGCKVSHRVVARRTGDVAAVWADPHLAGSLLGWKSELGLAEMCVDAWRWQSKNPFGYCE